MNKIDRLNNLPKTSDQIYTFVRAIKDEILSGNEDPLRCLIQLRAAKTALEILNQDEEILNYAIKEFEKYGKKVDKMYGAIVELKETGVKYDYAVSGDRQWMELSTSEKQIADQRKEREKFLKVLKSPIADAETGEVINPPVKTSKTNLVITISDKI